MTKKWVYLTIQVEYGNIIAFGKKKDAVQFILDKGYTQIIDDDGFYEREYHDPNDDVDDVANYYRIEKCRIR